MNALISIIVIAAATLALSGCIGAGSVSGIGKPEAQHFPVMTGIDLLGAERPVPASFEGQINLVSVAFQQEQQTDVNTWIAEADRLMGAHKELRYYELPVIEALNAMTRLWVNNGMRSGIPDTKARERTITIFTDRAEFLRLTGMQPDRIYNVLLDENGRELWRAEGPLTPELKIELTQQINIALK